jgi:hypothetical protein
MYGFSSSLFKQLRRISLLEFVQRRDVLVYLTNPALRCRAHLHCQTAKVGLT